jgi:hypothetical protein
VNLTKLPEKSVVFNDVFFFLSPPSPKGREPYQLKLHDSLPFGKGWGWDSHNNRKVYFKPLILSNFFKLSLKIGQCVLF